MYSNVCSALSSKIDWCEPNYVVSYYIAEFWNTISNLPFLVVSCIMMYLYQSYANRVPHSQCVNVVWLSLLIIGIGSVYFHATLSLLGQFMDEAGILWICSANAGVWMLDCNLPNYFQEHRGLYRLIIAASTLIATLLGALKPEINHFFLFLFIVPSVAVLKQQNKKITSPTFHKVSRRAMQVFFLALGLWILDRVFCKFWIVIHFPYLHGIWHILVCFSGYMTCVCFSYCFALEQAPHEQPILVFYTFFQWQWCGLWYVTFDDNSV